jgi:hypothetical protein
MSIHGDGPKIVLVKAYARWQRGKRRKVRSFLRAMSPPLSLRDSPLQLIFGF